MTFFQRIVKILTGIVMIAVAILFITYPDENIYQVLIAILAFGLAIDGIKNIIFYFTMARHMVGGKIILFQGVVVLDFALFSVSLTSVPKIYIMLYLIGAHAFSGIVETLRAMEARRTVDGPWRMKLGHGLVNFALALICLIFIMNMEVAVLIYSLGLIYSGIIRIISGFRRTSFIVIQ